VAVLDAKVQPVSEDPAIRAAVSDALMKAALDRVVAGNVREVAVL
jgi:hypothetical protein